MKPGWRVASKEVNPGSMLTSQPGPSPSKPAEVTSLGVSYLLSRDTHTLCVSVCLSVEVGGCLFFFNLPLFYVRW